jgi:hypothetical protein
MRMRGVGMALLFTQATFTFGCKGAAHSSPPAEPAMSSAAMSGAPSEAPFANILTQRSTAGACETLLAPNGNDPFVVWAKHFPVERQGFLVTLPSRAGASGLRERLSFLRAGMYEVVDCGDTTLLWIQAVGGCAELRYEANAYEQVIGAMKPIACFAHNPSECTAGDLPADRCRYLVAPIMSLPHCGAQNPEQKALAERLLIELGLAMQGTSPCESR